jgi:hypothetical protein
MLFLITVTLVSRSGSETGLSPALSASGEGEMSYAIRCGGQRVLRNEPNRKNRKIAVIEGLGLLPGRSCGGRMASDK